MADHSGEVVAGAEAELAQLLHTGRYFDIGHGLILEGPRCNLHHVLRNLCRAEALNQRVGGRLDNGVAIISRVIDRVLRIDDKRQNFRTAYKRACTQLDDALGKPDGGQTLVGPESGFANAPHTIGQVDTGQTSHTTEGSFAKAHHTGWYHGGTAAKAQDIGSGLDDGIAVLARVEHRVAGLYTDGRQALAAIEDVGAQLGD